MSNVLVLRVTYSAAYTVIDAVVIPMMLESSVKVSAVLHSFFFSKKLASTAFLVCMLENNTYIFTFHNQPRIGIIQPISNWNRSKLLMYLPRMIIFSNLASAVN